MEEVIDELKLGWFGSSYLWGDLLETKIVFVG
jgi:hypothetical protein